MPIINVASGSPQRSVVVVDSTGEREAGSSRLIEVFDIESFVVELAEGPTSSGRVDSRDILAPVCPPARWASPQLASSALEAIARVRAAAPPPWRELLPYAHIASSMSVIDVDPDRL